MVLASCRGHASVLYDNLRGRRGQILRVGHQGANSAIEPLARLSEVHLRGQMLGSPVVAPCGDILVGISLLQAGQESQGKLVCVDARTHQVRWQYQADGCVESTPVVDENGTLYFGDNAGYVHAVDAQGKCLWQTNVGSPVRSTGVLHGDDHVVFGQDDGRLVSLARAKTV